MFSSPCQTSFTITLHTSNMCHTLEVSNKKTFLEKTKAKKGIFWTAFLSTTVVWCLTLVLEVERKKQSWNLLFKSPFIQHVKKIWWWLSHFPVLYNGFQYVLSLNFQKAIFDSLFKNKPLWVKHMYTMCEPCTPMADPCECMEKTTTIL